MASRSAVSILSRGAASSARGSRISSATSYRRGDNVRLGAGDDDATRREGFVLGSKGVPAHFRGSGVHALAGRVAAELGGRSNRIDAEVIGRAARRVVPDREHFADHAQPAQTLQQLKQLWHVLVASGHPAD